MVRNYANFDRYLNSIEEDVYEQPPDPLHQKWGETVIKNWCGEYGFKTVLDVGCGQAQFRTTFTDLGKKWTGVTLGSDYDFCREAGYNVHKYDFSFLDAFPDGSFDLIFARHSLEHSPFPLITLMEWNRVSNKYLGLILPNPDHFKFFGRNHYSVMTNSHALWLAARAGWKAVNKDYSENQELRYFFEKAEPRRFYMWENEDKLKREYGSLS